MKTPTPRHHIQSARTRTAVAVALAEIDLDVKTFMNHPAWPSGGPPAELVEMIKKLAAQAKRQLRSKK